MRTLPPLRWQSKDGLYRVQILRRCFLKMERMATQYYPNEIGTSLVGQYSSDGHEAIVVGISPVPPDSQSGPFTFTRGIKGLRNYFLRVYRRFQGRRHRVGEWHSHPGSAAVASQLDDKYQMSIAKNKREKCPEAILIIIGGDRDSAAELGVYVYSRTRGKVALYAADYHAVRSEQEN